MITKTTIKSVIESHNFTVNIEFTSSLLSIFPQGELQVWKEFFKGLPQRIETWFHAQISRKWTFAGFVITFLLGLIISGIVEGTVFDVWKGSIQPWLIERSSFTHIVLLLMSLGWGFFILIGIILFGIYGAGKHRDGQLETIKRQNETYEADLTRLLIQVNDFTRELEQLRDQSTQQQEKFVQVASECELLRRKTKLLDLISNTDRELFILFTQLTFTEEVIQNFVEAIFRRTFELWGLDKVHRGGIYIPDPNNSEFLSLKWDYALGSASRHWDRWYIGAHDPTTKNSPRGIAGSVYMKGEDRVNTDITSDPDFVDMHQPKREVLPYRSSIHAVIHPDDKQKKLGVLCLDSSIYEFTLHDLTLVQQVATRIGWLIQTIETA